MNKNNHQLGQSTIEFIFTFIFGVSIVFLIFNSAMNYATGYLVHYATFMASRSYLTGDSYSGTFDGANPSFYIQEAERRARETFTRYNLGVFKISAESLKLNHTSNSLPIEEYLTTGAYTTFEQQIDALGRVTGETKLNLTSESFLGKEPTRFSCALQVCKAVTGRETCTRDMDVTLFDDGC